MQGTGNLIVYAGQLIELPGVGELRVGGQVRLEGTSSLYVAGVIPSNLTMEGLGELFVVVSEMPRGTSYIHKLESVGGDYNYALSKQYIPTLYSEGDDDYVPPDPVTGIAYFNTFVSYGYAEGNYGNGSAYIPALLSRGGDYNYSIGYGNISSLRSLGVYGINTLETFFSYSRMYSSIVSELHHVIVFMSDASIVSYFTGDKSYIEEIISAVTGTSILESQADYEGNLQSNISIQSFSTAQIGTKIALDSDSRTWVVNLETGASGQYDDYGFIKYFTRDGQSYGIAEDGIYLLEGDDDAGQEIDALIEVGRSNFGSSYIKHIPNIYAGVSSTGRLIIKLDADNQVYYYEARSYSDEIKNHRFDVGKGLRGNYFNLTLINQDGDDFELETITFEPLNTSRKS